MLMHMSLVRRRAVELHGLLRARARKGISQCTDGSCRLPPAALIGLCLPIACPSPRAHDGKEPPRLCRTIVGLRKCVAPAVGSGICPERTASAIRAAFR